MQMWSTLFYKKALKSILFGSVSLSWLLAYQILCSRFFLCSQVSCSNCSSFPSIFFFFLNPDPTFSTTVAQQYASSRPIGTDPAQISVLRPKSFLAIWYNLGLTPPCHCHLAIVTKPPNFHNFWKLVSILLGSPVHPAKMFFPAIREIILAPPATKLVRQQQDHKSNTWAVLPQAALIR